MGQVNVNTPRDGGEPAGSSGAGFIIGIIVAIIVIAALVYFLVLGGGNGDTDPGVDGDGQTNGETDPGTDDGETDGGDAPSEDAAPSGWRLVDIA